MRTTARKLVPQSVLDNIRYQIGSLSGIIEVSTSCNLRCTYCFAQRPNEGLMKSEVAKRIIEGLAQHNGTERPTKVIWHGGEPLLAGISFYREVLRIQEGLKDQGYTFHNSMQTNATLLTDEWIDFLRDNHFGVGSSLDGFREHHNEKRVDALGNGTYDIVLSNILHARERELSIGVICVIDRRTLPFVDRIYSEMKSLGLHFTMSPVTPTPSVSQELQPLSPEEYASVLIRLFDLWFDDPEPTITVNPPHSVVQGILYGGLPLFCNSDDSCFSKFISFLPDGSVFPCNRFAGEDQFRLGNIMDESLNSILSSPVRVKLLGRTKESLRPCSECESNMMCRGGCAHHAYAFHGDINSPDYYCRAFFDAFHYYYDRIQTALRSAELPTEIQETQQ